MNAVVNLVNGPARSVVEERALRPPVIGHIRPGIKVLTAKARGNAQAVGIYNDMVSQGHPFDAIAKVIESKCNLKNALVPKNTAYFTCRRSDFNNPDVADEILRLYGEDRGDGVKLYRFPVLFAFNDWMQNLPNQMTVYGTNGRKFFSQYERDGIRYCMTYAKIERDPRAQRTVRHFGGRTVIRRQDEAIPDGICDPEQCPQYQARHCNLSASFVFAVPDIKGLGLIELPTNSIYVLQKAYSAMQTVQLARGKLTGTRFWITKREFDITRINEHGEAVRASQMLTVLDADIDIGALLDAADDAPSALETASRAVALIEAGGNVVRLGGEVDAAISNAVAEAAVTDASCGPEAGVDVGATQVGGIGPAASVSTAAGQGTAATTGPLLQHVLAAQPATPASTETLADKRDRMSDLLQRLGLSAEDRKQDFRIYAHTKFGRGWSDREQDVDQMNARLVQALTDREAFDREIGEARQPTFLD
ncbi:recombination directionality factor [Paraburkholderia dipogonis]|uniref:recombination directionality factor n=1 Tax=Paraburkholderia dipogonis TaxID=1211383 RepID=UPI0038B8FF06